MIFRNAVKTMLLMFFLSVALTPTLVISAPLAFEIKPGSPNLVKFTSDAPMVKIVGVTDQISGTLNFDPSDMSGSLEAEFTVDMKSLDTDNKIRNKHMRDNHLETDVFPSSSFKLRSIGDVPGGKLNHLEPVTFNAQGDFNLHGITNRIDVKITAIWDEQKKTVETVAIFDLFLASYKIPRPQFLVMKLDEKQSVEIKFTAMAE